MSAKELRDAAKRIREHLEKGHRYRADAATHHVQISGVEERKDEDVGAVSQTLAAVMQSVDAISTAVAEALPMMDMIVQMQTDLEDQENRLEGMYRKMQPLVDEAEEHVRTASQVKASMIATNEAFANVYQQMRGTLEDTQKALKELKESRNGA